jgi:MOSC domain-containing protein YiiM
MYIKDLQATYLRPGKVEFISVRSERRASVKVLDVVHAIQNVGLEGDHYQNLNGPRQVTLMQAEHLVVLALLTGKESINPALVRRNIVVSAINLLSLKGKSFSVGEAVFEYTGECHPCTRMEENLGPGGYNAMRGHGGITAKIVSGGRIKIGDSVSILS